MLNILNSLESRCFSDILDILYYIFYWCHLPNTPHQRTVWWLQQTDKTSLVACHKRQKTWVSWGRRALFLPIEGISVVCPVQFNVYAHSEELRRKSTTSSMVLTMLCWRWFSSDYQKKPSTPPLYSSSLMQPMREQASENCCRWNIPELMVKSEV